MKNKILHIIFLALLSFSSAAEIYKWVDEDGQTHFSHERPDNSKLIPLKNDRGQLAKLKDYLYPFGFAAVLKESSKAYCDKKTALGLVRKRIRVEERKLNQLKNKYQSMKYKSKGEKNRAMVRMRNAESSVRELKSMLSSKLYKQKYVADMQRKCLRLNQENIIEKEIYDISQDGFKRVFKKDERKYIGYLGIALTKYQSGHDARKVWKLWNKKSNQKKFSRVERDKFNDIDILLMDEKANFAVAFLLYEDTLIEVQFGSEKFVEFQQLKFFVSKYAKWLDSK